MDKGAFLIIYFVSTVLFVAYTRSARETLKKNVIEWPPALIQLLE